MTTNEPSDEALIENYLHATIEWCKCGNATTWDARNAAEAALRARIASNAEALAKMQGRIAKRDREIGQMEAEINYQIARANKAGAALAECRAKLERYSSTLSLLLAKEAPRHE
jgi:chromosome segregation ATPase